MTEVKKCTLPEDINECRYFVRCNKLCCKVNKCSYQEIEEENIKPNQYVRKERWCEKYYKGSRPKKS